MRRLRVLGVALCCLLAALVPTTQAHAAAVPKYKNCKAMNAKYPHGVGRKGARDHTSGKPVTNFVVNTAIYRANTARDGDKDGIACEKR